MIASRDNALEETLSDVFKFVWNSYLTITKTEDTLGSEEIQDQVLKATLKAESGIHMVNQLELFSNNEDIEEVLTNEIKYMLFPALLAFFSTQCTRDNRMDAVVKAKGHYSDFLAMCRCYGVTSCTIPLNRHLGDDVGMSECEESIDIRLDLHMMAAERNSKIERYRQNKAFDARLEDLSRVVEREDVDDEVKRKYYLTQVKRWINLSLDEMDSLNNDKRDPVRISKSEHHFDARGSNTPRKVPQKPFIITRSVMEKVFGSGYPATPSMTIEEFYQQRVLDGTFPSPNGCSSSRSLPSKADDAERMAAELDEEEREKDRKAECDDLKQLWQTRNMDEFKDDHRRGSGNRMNMG